MLFGSQLLERSRGIVLRSSCGIGQRAEGRLILRFVLRLARAEMRQSRLQRARSHEVHSSQIILGSFALVGKIRTSGAWDRNSLTSRGLRGGARGPPTARMTGAGRLANLITVYFTGPMTHAFRFTP